LFTKYIFKNRVEYFCSVNKNISAGHYVKEYLALMETLKDYYLQENNDFIYFSYPSGNKTYTVAVQKAKDAQRVIVWL
jgi:hypothetical protein